MRDGALRPGGEADTVYSTLSLSGVLLGGECALLVGQIMRLNEELGTGGSLRLVRRRDILTLWRFIQSAMTINQISLTICQNSKNCFEFTDNFPSRTH